MVRPEYPLYVKIIWAIIFSFCSISFVAKITLVLISHPTLEQIGYIFLYAILFYCLFCLEGLHHVAVQLHSVDFFEYKLTIAANSTAVEQDNILHVASKLHENFSEFLIGRQIFTLIIIVSLTWLVDQLPTPQGVGLSEEFIATVLDSYVMEILLSALLPCWLAQMLPEMLVQGRSVKFLRNWSVRAIVYLAIRVARFGAGWPGKLVFDKIHRVLGFEGTEIIEVGDSVIFAKRSSGLGIAVNERHIRIAIDREQVTITDSEDTGYREGADRRGHRDVGRVVRAAVPNSKKIEFLRGKGTPPEGLSAAEWRAKCAIAKVSPVGEGIQQSLTELIMEFETTLETRIPRNGKKEETVNVFVEYIVDPFSTEESIIDKIIFDISKPTRKLLIQIVASEGILIVDPTLKAQAVDEIAVGSSRRLREVPEDRYTIERKNRDELTLLMLYPPLATRIELGIDIRKISGWDQRTHQALLPPIRPTDETAKHNDSDVASE